MKKVNLWGYTIYENGTIIGINGRKIVPQKQIKIKWNNTKDKYVSYARFVYYAFNYRNFNFHDLSTIIIHKDGNGKNNSINNLQAVKRNLILQGENNVSAKLSNKDVEDIKAMRNKGASYRNIAKEYNVSHTLIRGIIIGQFRNQENYIIK